MSKRKRQLESQRQYAKCPDCGMGNLVICEKAEDVKHIKLFQPSPLFEFLKADGTS